jgi:5-methyltetrahydrofolate--homocysteine methyltransferase
MLSKEKFEELIQKKILILDGAMGTMLQSSDIPHLGSRCPEELNITHPEEIKKVHQAYAQSGADIIITNTFGANRSKLGKYGLSDKVKEFNSAAVKNAKEACPNCWIAGGLGPVSDFLEPLGKISFSEAVEIYNEQAQALSEAGADLLIIETISDLQMLRAALIAMRKSFSGVIISSMTFQDLRTNTGTDLETYALVAEKMGADIVGLNCSDGPEGMEEAAKILGRYSERPLCFQPNAGMPKIIGRKTVWDYPPERFAEIGGKLAGLGGAILGGCCGTNPEFIKALAEKVNRVKPDYRNRKINSDLKTNKEMMISTRTRTLTIKPTAIAGERINPTNRKGFQAEIKEGKTNYAKMQGMQQVEEGAALLDINVGVPGGKEEEYLPKAITAVQSTVDVPLMIDTTNILALEKALQEYCGRAVINSVNANNESLSKVLPLARKYGAAVVGLCLSERGIPKTAEERIENAEKILSSAKKYGLNEEDILFDAVTLTIATNPEQKEILLETIKEMKRRGWKTILGVSNISHGLANRSEINFRFYQEAVQAGLDVAIFNPVDLIRTEAIGERNKECDVQASEMRRDENLPLREKIRQAIIHGDKESINQFIEEALALREKQKNKIEVNEIIISALEEVGKKFKSKKIFLPQVLSSAECAKAAFNQIKDKKGTNEEEKKSNREKGTILFATVENDIHDLGKNLVISLLESHNYKVIDLGVNVSSRKILSEMQQNKPDLIALSALMTTTVMSMEETNKEIRKIDKEIPIIVGGAVVTEEYAQEIQASYGADALEAVKRIGELIRIRKPINKEEV